MEEKDALSDKLSVYQNKVENLENAMDGLRQQMNDKEIECINNKMSQNESELSEL